MPRLCVRPGQRPGARGGGGGGGRCVAWRGVRVRAVLWTRRPTPINYKQITMTPHRRRPRPLHVLPLRHRPRRPPHRRPQALRHPPAGGPPAAAGLRAVGRGAAAVQGMCGVGRWVWCGGPLPPPPNSISSTYPANYYHSGATSWRSTSTCARTGPGPITSALRT